MISNSNQELRSDCIHQYCEQITTIEENLLRDLRIETKASLPGSHMICGHLVGSFLHTLVKLTQSKHILEIGTYTGYSALCLASGLMCDGELITCDIDIKSQPIAKKYFALSKHGNKIISKLVDALSIVDDFTANYFDFIFIDGKKSQYLEYYEKFLPKLVSGGCIVVDNIWQDGLVLDKSSIRGQNINKFNEFVKQDNRVQVSCLPIRDGLSIIIKL